MSSQILFGIDHFLQQRKYKKKRLALVTNDAALTSQGNKTRIALLQTARFVLHKYRSYSDFGFRQEFAN